MSRIKLNSRDAVVQFPNVLRIAGYILNLHIPGCQDRGREEGALIENFAFRRHAPDKAVIYSGRVGICVQFFRKRFPRRLRRQDESEA